MLVRERQSFRKFSLAAPKIVEESEAEILVAAKLPTIAATAAAGSVKSPRLQNKALYEFNFHNGAKLPSIDKSKFRRSTIAVNVQSVLINGGTKTTARFRAPSVITDILEDVDEKDIKKFSISSIAENFEYLQLKYSNQERENRLSIDKLNAFKRKCSMAIAKDEDYVENVLNKYKQKQISPEKDHNDEHDLGMELNSRVINRNRLHIGSLLSYEGQFATLKCIEDSIKVKIKECICMLSHSNEKRSRLRLDDKLNKRIYYHKLNLIKKLLTTLNITSNSLIMPQMVLKKEDPEVNLVRKAVISKDIDDGMSLLDEVNKLLKSASTGNGRKIRFNSDTWYSNMDNNSSSALSNDECFEDDGMSFQMIYEKISKFSEWSATWFKSFQ